MKTTPTEETKIREFNENLPGQIGIELVVAKDARSGDFVRFCEAFSRFAPKITITETKNSDGLPEIRITDNLRYKAIPVGPELGPFLEALTAVSANGAPPAGFAKYANIENRADLRLFVSPQCVFCPGAVTKLFPLAVYNPSVTLTVIDGFLFGELAESEGIVSAPTLILNGGPRWAGDFKLGEVADMIRTGDQSDMGISYLETLIQQGEAGRIAAMMLERKTVFPAFVDLLVHHKFDIRLGAMVAVETIAEIDMQLAGRLVEPLWAKYPDQNDQIRGDLLYVFGESGNEKTIPLVRKAINETENTELKEAGEEAIEKIMGRMSE